MAYQPIPQYNEDTAHISGDAGIPFFGLRSDTDASTASDGDYTLVKLDEEGRLKTSNKTASFALCQGTLTTTAASATGTVGDVATAAGYLSVNVSRASNIVFHVKNTGGTNQTAGNFTFEASIDSTTGTDGTWFAVQAVRSNANTIELTTGTLTLNAGVGLGYSYEASVNAYNWFRIRVNVNVTSGAADTWTIIRGSYATEPIPAAQVSGTQAVSGTVTANWGTITTPTASIVNSAATTNGTVVKASAGTLYSITVSSTRATTCYLKFHNSTTVTAGTTAVALTIAVPTNSTVTVPFGTPGMRFGTGICLSITGAAADNDTTAIGAGEVKVLTSYI